MKSISNLTCLQTLLNHARQERDKCAAYEGPDMAGACMGWADWSVEVMLLERELSTVSDAAGNDLDCGRHGAKEAPIDCGRPAPHAPCHAPRKGIAPA